MTSNSLTENDEDSIPSQTLKTPFFFFFFGGGGGGGGGGGDMSRFSV